MIQIPVIPLGDVLLTSIQGELQDSTAANLQNDVTDAVRNHGARGVIIDISSVDMVDSYLGRILAEIAGCSRLLGAETVLVGMRPAVAITLVELGLTLPHLRTARTVADAAALLGLWVPFHTPSSPAPPQQEADGGSGTQGPG